MKIKKYVKNSISILICTAVVLTTIVVPVYAEDVFVSEDVIDVDDVIISEDISDIEDIIVSEDIVNEEDIVAPEDLPNEEDVLEEEISSEECEDFNEDGAVEVEPELPSAEVRDGSQPNSIDKLLSTEVDVVDGKDVKLKEIPYGHVAGESFLISKENELLLTISDGVGNNSQELHQSFMDSATQVGGWDNQYLDMQSVAFDPSDPTDNEHGRDKYVAYVGIRKSNSDYVAYVWAENVKTKTKTSPLSLGKTWLNKDDSIISQYYASNNFVNITSGDYNGDKKDTIIVYAPLYNSKYDLKLIEVSLNVTNMSLSIVHSGNDLLHHKYRQDGISIYKEESHLGVDLATGDVNGDGIDDLAVTSYLANADDDGDGKSIDLYTPQISVSKGVDNPSHNILAANGNNLSYTTIRDEAAKEGKQCVYNTSVFPAVTVTDINNDGYDEIVTAGYKTQLLATKNNKNIIDDARHNITNEKINTEVFTFKDDKGLKTMAEGSKKIYEVDSNGWTQYAVTIRDILIAKPLTVGYYPNGKVEGAQVFISGTIYSFVGCVPQEKYTSDYFRTADKGGGGAIINDSGIIQAQAGNFTGSTIGREQIVYTIALRQQVFHNYHCFAGIINAEYGDTKVDGKITKFGDITSYVNHNTNDNYYVNGHINTYDEPVNLLITAVDCDDDGLLARFKSRYEVMSDVEPVVILQAHPYFDDFDTTEGITEYKITETNIISDSNGVDAGISFGRITSAEVSAGVTTEAESEFNIKIGFSHEVETEDRYSISTTFSASDCDEVVVSRRPVYIYTFSIFDNETGKWSDDPTYGGYNKGNDYAITINKAPVYTMLTVPEYNLFVDKYNNIAEEQTDKLHEYFKNCGDAGAEVSIDRLEKITDTHLLDNERNPYGYYYRNESSEVEEFKATEEEQQGNVYYFDEHNDSGSIERFMEQSHSESSIFNFSAGVEIGYSAAAGVDVAVGKALVGMSVKGEVSYTKSQVTGHEDGTEVGCGMKGFGGRELSERTGVSEAVYDQFGFQWWPCTWKFYPHGKDSESDNDDDEKYAPVIGYIVNKDQGMIDAPPKPVKNLSAIETTITEDGATKDAVKLTWQNPAYDRAGESGNRMGVEYYRIYVKNADNIHAGGYTAVLDTDKTLKTEITIKKEEIEAALRGKSITPQSDGKFTFVISTLNDSCMGSTRESVWSNDATIKLDEHKAIYYSVVGNGSIVVRDYNNGSEGQIIPNGGHVILGKTYKIMPQAASNSYLTKLVVEQDGDVPTTKTYNNYETTAEEKFTVSGDPINITAYFDTFKDFDLDIKCTFGGMVRVTDVTNDEEIYVGLSDNLQNVIREGHTIKIEAVNNQYNDLVELTVNDSDYTAQGYCEFIARSDIKISASYRHETCEIELDSEHGSLEIIAFDQNAADDVQTGVGSLQTGTVTVLKGQMLQVEHIPESGYMYTGLYVNNKKVNKTDMILVNDEIISDGKIRLKGDFEAVSLQCDKASYAYTGEEIIPKLKVMAGSKELIADVDYIAKCIDNINIGTATVIVNGTGEYSGIFTTTFKIVKASQTISATISNSSIAVGKTSKISAKGIGAITYQSEDESIATVSKGGTVTAKKVGTVKIIVNVAGNDNYKSAKKTITVKVLPAATTLLSAKNTSKGVSLSWKKIAGATGYYVYKSGKKIATVKGNTNVTYVDTKASSNGTKYSYKIYPYAETGTGLASKTIIYYYLSKPGTPKLTSKSAAKVKIEWAQNKKATGYQIIYSYDKSFDKPEKTITVKNKSTLSKTLGNLKKGKRIYVKIRTYKTVNNVKYYSPWSGVKDIVVKK